jgi:glutathione peroxidase
VTFPLFAKIHVRGRDRAPLYTALSREGPVRWNYTKYLVARDGRVIESFGSTTSPKSRGIREAVEAALESE